MIVVAAAAVALATALTIHSFLLALQRSFAAYRDRYGVESPRDLRESLPLLQADDVRRLALTGNLLGAAGGYALFGVVGLVGGGIGGLVAPGLIVSALRTRRIRRFDGQLVDALETAAAGLQAGLSLQQALEGAAAESAAPLRDEFGLALREIRMGASPEVALESLAARVDSEELTLFVAGTALARQVGGNLAASYRTIADALRERFRVEGKLRSLTSQGRMQGWVVGALPLGLALVIHRMRPDLVEPMLEHPFGWALVTAVVVLETAGFFWIRRLVAPAY